MDGTPSGPALIRALPGAGGGLLLLLLHLSVADWIYGVEEMPIEGADLHRAGRRNERRLEGVDKSRCVKRLRAA